LSKNYVGTTGKVNWTPRVKLVGVFVQMH